MNNPEKSEAAEGATSTTSESNDPRYHDEAEESAATVANAPAESKPDDDSPVDGDDREQGDVAVEHGSNPVPSGGKQTISAVAAKPTLGTSAGEPTVIAEGGTGAPPTKRKRGRPPLTKNGEGKKQPATKKLAEQGTKHAPLQTPVDVNSYQAGEFVLAKTSDFVLRPPFSDLFPVDERTRASIKSSIEMNGYDDSQPIHGWRNGDELVVVDGCTRFGIVVELGLPTISAFIHDFADENAALEFGIACQMKRRNLSDGDLTRFVELYDEKITPGSAQSRAAGGTFQPKASSDAPGKSATRTAAKLGVSTSKVERARRVNQKADETTKKAVQANKLSVNAALKQMKAASAKAKPSEQSKPPTPPSSVAVAARPAPGAIDESQDAHATAIEAADTAETFLRNAQGKTLTEQQRREWKQVIDHIVRLLSTLGVRVSLS